MRPTFPLTFSMDADVLEQQLAQLFSQCCIGFTKKSFAASALKPNRNGLVFPTYHIQATLYATLLDDNHGGGSGLGLWKMKHFRIRCLQDTIPPILLPQCRWLKVSFSSSLRANSLTIGHAHS